MISDVFNSNNTVSFNRTLAHAIGVHEAMIYSALIAKQAYYEKRNMLDDDGFFYSTIADLKESTALSRYQQERALSKLLEVGLIESCVKGLPARRYFRVSDNDELLQSVLKTDKQVCRKSTNLFAENQQSSLQETDKPTYKPNNKTKVNNPNHSIVPDTTDRIDERREYLDIIRENIEYDSLSEKEKADELVAIMLDVVCSTRDTVRVNGEDMPHEVVKSRFLKLNSNHIDYVLTALQKNTSDVRNIRAYLITALYNAPETMDGFYTAWVNHDMKSTK